MNNPTIFINVSKKKQDRYLISYNDVDYYIISDYVRNCLSNMFDGIGNISNYSDYYAFQSKYPQFKAICKSMVSNKIKEQLESSHGLLVGIDIKTRELLLPDNKTVNWILHKHGYQVYTPNTPIEFVKASELYISPFNEIKELQIILPEKEEEPVTKEAEPVTKEAEPVVQTYSSKFWSYLGWS